MTATIDIQTVRTYKVADVVSVLCTAFESGWCWWGRCGVTAIAGLIPNGDGFWWERLERDHEAWEPWIEGECPSTGDWKRYRFSLESFAQAWAGSRFADQDPGDIDADDADVILQTLLFGRVEYA